MLIQKKKKKMDISTENTTKTCETCRSDIFFAQTINFSNDKHTGPRIQTHTQQKKSEPSLCAVSTKINEILDFRLKTAIEKQST